MTEDLPNHRIVREVEMPLTTNMTSTIGRPTIGSRFELKQNMVQLLHSSGQFIGLSWKDPQVHFQNFLEIRNTNYVRLTLFPSLLFGEEKKWLNANR